MPYLAGLVWLLVWQLKAEHSAWQLVLSVAVAVVVLAVWLKWLLSPFSRSALAIKHGLLALKDADFSISIHNQRYLEMLELVDAYNQLTQVLRAERMALNQRELLLDKVIQHAWFDPAQIEQVMVNLVKNAQESGSDAQEIGFELRQHGQHLSFMVFDRGTGMTESQLSQALLPFYTTKSAGSGIGLTLCNEIISAHQGKLRLYNRDYGGLCVSFSIPLHPQS
ncbi:ATP-binding protein [Bowmanella yangjiangensis]|uniref:histidine kinase n=1 Tax=Bowmanella yangjiangensis TaxID=2811230 RepID=A0ABS3CUV2_9ALTE|nr:ATP-binding protein [Bowmanella yangjiangensis]MBN7819931.1 ATP-binding protein [Bowmanella yangjiangensis]